MQATNAFTAMTGLLAVILAFAFDSVILGICAGAVLDAGLSALGRDLLESIRPATKYERRMAARVEQSVRERSLTLDRNTGEHAA